MLRKKLVLLSLFLLLSTALASTTNESSTFSAFTSPLNTKSIIHQEILLSPGITVYKPISSCYNAIVNMTVTDNSTIIQLINFQSFFITIILPNQPVANSTNTLLFSPNNILSSIDLFPSVPIIMRISFSRICLPSGTNPQNDINLVYWDGSNFASWLPTFGANNTITWN